MPHRAVFVTIVGDRGKRGRLLALRRASASLSRIRHHFKGGAAGGEEEVAEAANQAAGNAAAGLAGCKRNECEAGQLDPKIQPRGQHVRWA